MNFLKALRIGAIRERNTVYQAQYNKLRMFLRFLLYGGIILGGNCTRNNSVWLCYWRGKMYQEQLCIVVLLGKGRCTKNTSMVVFWGEEDALFKVVVLLGKGTYTRTPL